MYKVQDKNKYFTTSGFLINVAHMISTITGIRMIQFESNRLLMCKEAYHNIPIKWHRALNIVIIFYRILGF